MCGSILSLVELLQLTDLHIAHSHGWIPVRVSSHLSTTVTFRELVQEVGDLPVIVDKSLH